MISASASTCSRLVLISLLVLRMLPWPVLIPSPHLSKKEEEPSTEESHVGLSQPILRA